MSGPTLKVEIRDRMTAAMKSGDTVGVGALRMLLSSIRYREVELGHDLSDDEVRDVAAKEVKKHTESIEAFRSGDRSELADKEEAERAVIEPYAPAPLDLAAIDALVDEAFEATGAATAGDLGKVMGYVMGKARGRVDGSAVQQKVRARLGA